MVVLVQRHHRAQEGQPDEEPARDFFRHRDAGVEGIAQHHVAEHQHHHHGQRQHQQGFEGLAVEVEEALTGLGFSAREAENAISSILKQQTDADTSTVLRKALAYLGARS